ncbi:MAG: hypothetical protein A2Y34_16520 [Spirochaetes bacterium GWC1_27_15]|nr:MAG: hypothetical protein A2Z98_08150 [Spirochaetes bacterium GWB1_27_13]OHD22581.1 MAG: hypothetical protein A2Y34_16520 [Spirochaetes bacterium GWC1_27_15]
MMNLIYDLIKHNQLTFICNIITLSFLLFMGINYLIFYFTRSSFVKDKESLLGSMFIFINVIYILSSWIIDVYIYKGVSFYLILVDFILTFPAIYSYFLFIPILEIKIAKWVKFTIIIMIPIFIIIIIFSLVIESLYGVKFYLANIYPINVGIITTIKILSVILFYYSAIKSNTYKKKEKLVVLISLIIIQFTYGLDRILEILLGNYLFNRNYMLLIIICFLFFIVFIIRANRDSKILVKQATELEQKNKNLTNLNEKIYLQKEALEKSNIKLLESKRKQEENFENYVNSFFKTRSTLLEMVEAWNTNKKDLIKAIEVIFDYNFALDREKIMKDFDLSETLMNVLYEMLFFDSNKEIAYRLNDTTGNIGVYKQRILKRLKAYTRGEIINKLLKYIKEKI